MVVDCICFARYAIDAELGQLLLTDPVERRGCRCRLLTFTLVACQDAGGRHLRCMCLVGTYIVDTRPVVTDRPC
jgi:hypothetical protein